MNKLQLTTQQLAFMDTFGYLIFPSLLSDKLDRIIGEFEGIFARHARDPKAGIERSCIIPFIDQAEYLAALLDDPRVDGIWDSLLGEDYCYTGSDGNFYVGDTDWHSDNGWRLGADGKPPRISYKMALYLDPVAATSGALRVIPGSHRFGEQYGALLQSYLHTDPPHKVCAAPDTLGVAGHQVPAISLDSNPGDVVVFNHGLKHSSWGGSNKRRMFTINCTARYKENETQLLRNQVSGLARFWLDSPYGEAMLKGAGPQRMVHLQQALGEQAYLAEEVRKAKLTMKEPAVTR